MEKLYYCSYTSRPGFTLSKKVHGALTEKGKKVTEKYIPMYTDPFFGCLGLVNVWQLEKARLSGLKSVVLFIYSCSVYKKDVKTNKQVAKYVHNTEVTKEHWYDGVAPVKFVNVGYMEISTALKDRRAIKYKKYGDGQEVTTVHPLRTKLKKGKGKEETEWKHRGKAKKKKTLLKTKVHRGSYYVATYEGVSTFGRTMPNCIGRIVQHALDGCESARLRKKSGTISVHVTTFNGILKYKGNKSIERSGTIVSEQEILLDEKTGARKLITVDGEQYLSVDYK